MITPKLSKEELALVDIIRHPILGPEFIRNIDVLPENREEFEQVREESKRDPSYYYEHTSYQVMMACDFNHYVVFCTARAVGKTESLIDKILFYLLNNFWGNEYLVLTTPNKVHIEPIFKKLVRWLRTNNFLKHLVDRRSINSADHNIKLLSGGTLDGRIAGTSGTGANVVGTHTPIILLDEGAYYPWGTWQELQPCLNDWMLGYQVVVAGVPDGRREHSVLYYADQKAEIYTKHNVAAHDNPRWTEESEQKARIDYGGIDSEDYTHMVLGEHGSPVWSVFDRIKMDISDYECHVRELKREDLQEDSQAGYKQILGLPKLPRNSEDVLLGIDLGYTEPTAIVVMTLINDKWRIHARLNWYQVKYPLQEKLIAYLTDRYNPGLIGIDEGSSGKSLVQHLLHDDIYKDKKFAERLIPVNFAASIPIGKDEEGKDITERAKEFGVRYLQELVDTHKIQFTMRDEPLITELERTTYTKNPSGRLTFRTFTERGGLRGADHNLSALLSGFVAWYLQYESLFLAPKTPTLMSPRWILA